MSSGRGRREQGSTTRNVAVALGVLALLAALAYLWFARPPLAPAAAQSRESADRADAPVVGSATSTPPAGTADPASSSRSELPGAPRLTLRGTLLPRFGVPFTGAKLLAHEGSVFDRSEGMVGMFDRVEQMQTAAQHPPESARQVGECDVGPDGSFLLQGLTCRHLRLSLDHRFYGFAQPYVVHLHPERPTRVVIEPYLGGHLVGRCAGAAGPWTGAVRLIGEADTMSLLSDPNHFVANMLSQAVPRSAPLRDDGTFEFRAVPACARASLWYREGLAAARAGPLRIQGGQTRELVLHMTRCGTLTVRVTDAEGGPLPAAHVRARPLDVTGIQVAAHSSPTAIGDREGVARLQGLAPGTYSVVVSASGRVSAEREVTVVGGESHSIDIKLATGGAVRGTVVDSRKQPIADAGVAYVQNPKVPMLGDVTSFTGEDLLSERARSSKQRSDVRGAFVLHGIEDQDEFAVAAWHKDYEGGLARGVRTGDRAVVIELKDPAALRGRVVADDGGAPMRDFHVAVLVRMAMVLERPARSTTVADSSDGAFHLQRVPSGSVTLQVQAEGHAELRKSITISAGQALDVGELRLQKGATVRGLVRTAAGKPIAGASVAQRAGGMLDNPLLRSMLGSATAITDDAGRFELRGLPAGGLKLQASSPEHASGTSDRLQLEAGKTLDGVEIVLAGGGQVEGRILLPAGASRQGWLVILSNNQGGSMRSERIDDDGTFRFDGVDPGRYDVQGMQEERMSELQSAKIALLRPGAKMDISGIMRAAQDLVIRTRCRVRDGETTHVELDARDLGEAGVTIRVEITVGDRPLAVGLVELESLASGEVTHGLVQDGGAAMRPVPSGHYRAQVRRGVTMTPVGNATLVTVPKVSSHTIRIELPGGGIRGKVVDERSGSPLPRAIVRLVADRSTQPDQIDETGFAITGDDGAFHFDGLDAGRYGLFANDSFFNPTAERKGGRLEGITVSAGTLVENVVLRARAAARVSVRVRTAAGEAHAHAMVLAVDASGQPLGSLPVLSDARGNATLLGLPPGPARVVALGRGWAPGFSTVEELTAGREVTFDVELPRGPHVQVRIEDRAGKPIPDAKLSARWRRGPWVPLSLVQRFDAKNGHYDLGPLPAGAMEIRVHRAGAPSFTAGRTLPDGPSVELVITVPE